MATKKRHLSGWAPDRPDFRDLRFTPRKIKLPTSIDLRTTPNEPPVYDQGQLGSCTGNGVGDCFEFELRKQGLSDFVPSRLFIYYNERVIEGTVKQDAGAQIRDGIKAVAHSGAPDEQMWPYVIKKFSTKPPAKVYKAAALRKVSQYKRVDNSDSANLKMAIASGFPVVFGATLYESFESRAVEQTGRVPMPKKDEKTIGGHCMVIVGYQSTDFIVRNSWGTTWGDKGYCRIPQAYLCNTDLADDFWIITEITK